jgi:hypothetical protein
MERIEKEFRAIEGLRREAEQGMDAIMLRSYRKTLSELRMGVEGIVNKIEEHFEARDEETSSTSEVDSLATAMSRDLDRKPRTVKVEETSYATPPQQVHQSTLHQPPPQSRDMRDHESSDNMDERQLQNNAEPTEASATSGNHVQSDNADISPLLNLARTLEKLTCQAELPYSPVLVFDGSPLQYTKFVQDFRARVDDKPLTEGVKFAQLVMATSGRAREVVELFRDTATGYFRALRH